MHPLFFIIIASESSLTETPSTFHPLAHSLKQLTYCIIEFAHKVAGKKSRFQPCH